MPGNSSSLWCESVDYQLDQSRLWYVRYHITPCLTKLTTTAEFYQASIASPVLLTCYYCHKAGHRLTLRSYVFAFWHRASVYVWLSAHLRGDESSTCVCLRLQEQCLHSKITSVARVAHVLLLRCVAVNVSVNTLASKLTRKRSNCSKAPRNPHKVDLCGLAYFSCRVYAETQSSTCGRLNPLRLQYVILRTKSQNHCDYCAIEIWGF